MGTVEDTLLDTGLGRKPNCSSWRTGVLGAVLALLIMPVNELKVWV